MQICIDVQSAIMQQAGVGRYTTQLVTHLAPLLDTASGDALRLAYFDFKGKGQPLGLGHAETRSIRWCPGRLAQRLWRHLQWPPYDTFSGAADVFHFPNFIAPPLRRGRTVVTIHDMSFARHPELADEKNQRYLNHEILRTVDRADAIITDSTFSADEITSMLPVDPETVFPIHLGISADFVAPPEAQITAELGRLGIDRPYILTVGTLEPRKNIARLIDLFESLTPFDGLLVLAGNPGWKYEPILDRIRRSPAAARIRRLNYVPDHSLPALYAGAQLFVITSFYEGFGFPPLEAMACGTPVLSSTGGSLAEVLGHGAVLVREDTIDAWHDAASRLLQDSNHRATSIAAGREQAGLYRWSETARQTLDVYRKVARA